jgi:hypothetical protein
VHGETAIGQIGKSPTDRAIGKFPTYCRARQTGLAASDDEANGRANIKRESGLSWRQAWPETTSLDCNMRQSELILIRASFYTYIYIYIYLICLIDLFNLKKIQELNKEIEKNVLNKESFNLFLINIY